MNKPILKSSLFFLILSLVVLLACEDSVILVDLSDETPPADDLDDSGEDLDIRHVITDRTGKQWDITHAVQNYGFDPDGFQFGLGPDAIKPILDPQMVCEGEDGYPPDDATFLVMATSLNGHTRAYPLSIMSRHEIADDQFGDDHVAVAY